MWRVKVNAKDWTALARPYGRRMRSAETTGAGSASGAADADLGVAVHGAEDGYGLAHSGFYGADGEAYEGFGAGSAT